MKRRSQQSSATAPRAPSVRTIRAALRERCALVERLQRQVEQQGERVSPRIIHDLRVATRRADATVRLYNDWLPARRARRLRRWLQKVRRRASPLRDLDVLKEFLAHPPSGGSTTAHRRLRRRLAKRRRNAARDVLRTSDAAARERLRNLVRAIARRVRWRGPDAEPSCAQLFDSVRTGATWLAAAPRQLKSGRRKRLHQLRIRLRRLRYQLELMAQLLIPVPPPLPDVLDTLRALQDGLGARHDAAMHQRILSKWRRQECAAADERGVLDACLAQLRRPTTTTPSQDVFRQLKRVQRRLESCQAGAPQAPKKKG